jgi:carbonic anhydrase
MSAVHEEVLAANQAYAESFGEKAQLPMPPGRRFTILTCMDARLDPAKFAGLAEGDAHVIRNAGGRASDDAIRSLVISYKFSVQKNGLSFITPIVGWKPSQTRLCGVCWQAA